MRYTYLIMLIQFYTKSIQCTWTQQIARNFYLSQMRIRARSRTHEPIKTPILTAGNWIIRYYYMCNETFLTPLIRLHFSMQTLCILPTFLICLMQLEVLTMIIHLFSNKKRERIKFTISKSTLIKISLLVPGDCNFSAKEHCIKTGVKVDNNHSPKT